MEKNARGFNYSGPIEGHYGGAIRAYVSSGNTPALWINIKVPHTDDPLDSDDATILLTLEDVKHLEKQLKELRKNHFLA